MCGSVLGKALCDHCQQLCSPSISVRRSLPYLNQVVSFSDCYEVFQSVFYKLKFESWSEIGSLVGNMLISDMKSPPFMGVDIFLPVPISSKRHQRRGFNQVDLIFQPMMYQFGLPYDSKLLLRHCHTPPLFSYSPMSRKSLLNGVFSINEEACFQGASVVICDDMVTSGSTLVEMAKLIRSYGAVKVSALCVVDVQC